MPRMTWSSIVLVAAIAHPCIAQCGPSWSSRFHNNGTTSNPRAFARLDEDGNGPATERFFAVGSFSQAGGAFASGVGRWDGVRWTGLKNNPGDPTGLVGEATRVVRFDPDGDGPEDAILVIGGTFLKTGGNLACPGMVTWNGMQFQSVGTLSGSTVTDMVVHDFDGDGPDLPVVVIAGYLVLDTPGFSGGLYTYDGTSIQRLTPWISEQPGETPKQLVSWDPDGEGPGVPLLVGWNHPFISAWDGSTWTELAGTTVGFANGTVKDLEVFDEDGPEGPNGPSLIATGTFTTVGVVPALRIARYRGGMWSSMGSGLDGDGSALGTWDPDVEGSSPEVLVVGGLFANAGGTPARRVAQWNGSAWSQVGDGIAGSSSSVSAFGTFDIDGAGPAPTDLYIAGDFGSSQSGQLIPAFARLHNGVWDNVGEGVISSVRMVRGFEESAEGIDGPFLFAAGPIFAAGGAQNLNRAVILDADGWHGLGAGLSNTVANNEWFGDAVLFDVDGDSEPNLVVGGEFDRSGAAVVENLVYFDGSAWVDMGAGPMTPNGNEVTALAVFDPDGSGPEPDRLFVGGAFHVIGGLSIPYLAMLGDSGWEPLGAGLDGPCNALCVFDADGTGPGLPALYVGGSFNNAGGAPASKIAKWDGSTWLPLGTGAPPTNVVRGLTVHDPDGAGPGLARLAIIGSFATMDGVATGSVALYDGLTFSGVGAWPFTGGEQIVSIDEDGDGPDPPVLIIESRNGFGTYNSINYQSIARWNGLAWDNMQSGISNGAPWSITTWDEDGEGPTLPAVYVGGTFTAVGGEVSQSVARWGMTDAPNFVSLPGAVYFDAGDTITLHTPAGADQATAIRWTRNGSPLSDSDRVSGTDTTTVTIVDALAADAGDYAAELSSSCGATIGHVQVFFGAPPPACAGDINGDGFTNAADFTILAGNFGSAVTPNTDGDLNGDGVVNAADFVILAGDFGCGS